MFGDGTGVGINFSEYLIHTIKMKLIKCLVYMKKKGICHKYYCQDLKLKMEESSTFRKLYFYIFMLVV